jgi:FkbM family methyltransferase
MGNAIPKAYKGAILQLSNRRCFAIRFRTTDVLVVRELFLRADYDPLIKSFNLPRDEPLTCLDLGANIGLAAVLLADQFPKMKTLAVEPEEENYRVLVENAQRNGEFATVRAFVGAEEGMAYLDTTEGEWGYRMTRDRATGKSATILKIPDLLLQMRWSTVDLLKCDIEGSEQELFAACGAWIASVRHLLIELHPPNTIQSLVAALKPYGEWQITGSTESGLFALKQNKSTRPQ